ncbi:protein KAKU4 isoform X2 [Corylus avellana]|uniref:protein KAKU4 isoform X2 n=1 Tax=Corylus avellana TaxID=13451 RepID=UPI00286A2BAB|nr:protein KAKU4 isoform X2 [Corylus avellana]
MATIFRSRRAVEPRSGGKMVRARRAVGPRTPYERPRLASQDGPENPSWLSRLLYSPSRIIVSGAGKLLSTVFSSETSSSSSSSSASSSGGDSGSEDDIENDDDDISTRRANGLTQKDGSSEMIKYFRKEPQTPLGKSETKCLIEQLLMQETFSREECNRLIMIIKSRVVDWPSTEVAEDGRLNTDMPDLCSTAIMEAKKWLKEKKLTNSKSELDHGTCTLNSIMVSPFTEVEVGSPVDMARTYMQGRPPWASPSENHVECKYPSPIGIQLYKEETPFSVGGKSTSSLKLKRESPGTGSWNIQEEIRRVRSKATEEMLRTLPSSKIDRSAFSLEHKSSPNSLVTEKLDDSMGDKMLTSTQPVDASLNLAIERTTSHGFPVLTTQDGMQKEALSPNPAVIASEQNQDLEATRIIEEKEGSRDGTEGMVSQGEGIQSSEDMNTVSHCDAGPVNVDGKKDAIVTNEQRNSMVGGTIQGGAIAANGFPSSGYSLLAGRDTEQNPVPGDAEHNPNSSSHDTIAAADVLMEETCELLTESSMEVPNVDSVAEGRPDSSNMQYEELSEDLSQPNSKHTVEDQTSRIVENRRGKKMSGYNRRGRSRVRGK